MSPLCGTTKSSSRRTASRTVWADPSGACSPRTTPSGSHRGSASRGVASDSVFRRRGGGAVPVPGQGYWRARCCATTGAVVAVAWLWTSLGTCSDKFQQFSVGTTVEVPQLQFIDSVRASSLNRDRHPGYSSCAMPGSSVDTCSLTASGCCWPFCPHFLREVEPGS